MDYKAIFRERLRTARKLKGWKQKTLATAIDRATHHISNYETGTRYPNFSTAIKMAVALGVSLDYLAGLNK